MDNPPATKYCSHLSTSFFHFNLQLQFSTEKKISLFTQFTQIHHKFRFQVFLVFLFPRNFPSDLWLAPRYIFILVLKRDGLGAVEKSTYTNCTKVSSENSIACNEVAPRNWIPPHHTMSGQTCSLPHSESFSSLTTTNSCPTR